MIELCVIYALNVSVNLWNGQNLWLTDNRKSAQYECLNRLAKQSRQVFNFIVTRVHDFKYILDVEQNTTIVKLFMAKALIKYS